MANEPQAPGTPAPESGTSIEKFKSADERDKAYLELEKMSLGQAQRLAELEKKLDSWENQRSDYNPYDRPQNDNRSFTDLYPGQGQLDQREAQLASKLLTKPTEVLEGVYSRAVQDTMAQVSNYLSHVETINRFKSDNPDLAKHEEIVAMFVRRQPQNLSADERLRRAAPEARKYIADIAKAGGPAAPSLDPHTYVESPTQRSAPSTAAPAQEPNQEDDLSEYIKERNARMAKRAMP